MMDPSTPGPAIPPQLQPLVAQYKRYTRMYQTYLDRTAPQVAYRWLATAGFVSLFLLRVVLSQGVRRFILDIPQHSQAYVRVPCYSGTLCAVSLA